MDQPLSFPIVIDASAKMMMAKLPLSSFWSAVNKRTLPNVVVGHLVVLGSYSGDHATPQNVRIICFSLNLFWKFSNIAQDCDNVFIQCSSEVKRIRMHGA